MRAKKRRGAKVTFACALTFDFDAMSVWLGSYKSRNPSVISRGEFGAVAVPRILDILKRHGVPGSFCVPGHTALAYPALVKRIHDEGHEIAHHGWVHENPADFDEAGERANLEQGLKALKEVAGVTPKGYRSPAWDFSENTVKILQDYGFLYDSSLMGSDFIPYYARIGDKYDDKSPYVFGPNIDLVELPVTWILDDFPHFEFAGDTQGLAAPSKVEEIWRAEFDYGRKNAPGGLYNLTMHPQVIGRGHRLMMLERLIEHFKSQPGVAFMTLADYAAQWRAANPLEVWRRSGAIHAQPIQSRGN
jgi:peptidoglycan/xylan/chitin deacetylase (PgdA/CDA1 family)